MALTKVTSGGIKDGTITNEDTCQWDSPVPYPDDDKFYTWDETTTNWKEVS